ncbi:MAG: cobalamin-dependent protein, partial [Deltaproteobacteria bacterium]|nr:cobalamin-dependent protein [Deltaproteobacteria bacterium]
MKVTLIYPAIGITGFGCKEITSGEVTWINHGLASIGAVLKEAGHDVYLIDMRRLSGWEQFDKLMTTRKPDIVGISISAKDLKPADEAIKHIKKTVPDCKIVVGGIQPTQFPEKFKNNPDIDHIVKGEGESAMGNICTHYEVSRMGETVVPPSRVIKGKQEDLDSLPFVDRALFDYKLEMDNPFILGAQRTPMVTMLAGRGCPYKCGYCQPAENSVFGTPYRVRSVDHVIDELKLLKDKYNFQSVLFWDDTFTIKEKWVEEFCSKYTF